MVGPFLITDRPFTKNVTKMGFMVLKNILFGELTIKNSDRKDRIHYCFYQIILLLFPVYAVTYFQYD